MRETSAGKAWGNWSLGLVARPNIGKVLLVLVFGLLIAISMVVVIDGTDRTIAGDWLVYCQAAELFPSPAMYTRVDQAEQLYFRYSPPFAWFMSAVGCQSRIGWLLGISLAYFAGLVLFYRSKVFEPIRSWVLGGIANSHLVVTLGFLNVSLAVFPLVVSGAGFILANASVWLTALMFLPALLTKPHWAIYFLGVMWLKSPRRIFEICAAVGIVYLLTVGISALLLPNGWLLWETYAKFLISGNEYFFTSLPTYQQGAHQWLVFGFGDAAWVHAIYWLFCAGLLVNYPVQVLRIVKGTSELKAARLVAITYLSAALLLPDLQETILAFIPMALVVLYPMRNAPGKVLLALCWIAFVLQAGYAITGVVGYFFADSGELVHKLLLYQSYTPIDLVLLILLLVTLSYFISSERVEAEATAS